MSMVAVPGELACLEALSLFLAATMPANTPAMKTQVNRVAEPSLANFVMMTPGLRRRLGTNADTYDDCQFVGSIAGTTLTVSSVAFGTIKTDRLLFGVDVAANTRITGMGTGTGGIGTYTISTAQTVASEKMAAGAENLLQPIELTIQTDFYGDSASDNVQTFTTLFRDEWGASFFSALSESISPLYTDEPKQVAFTSEQDQYQDRWIVNTLLQVNAVVTVPKQFADQIAVSRIPVDAFYVA